MTTTEQKYGFTTWDEETNKFGNRPQREDLPRIPYLKLQEGNNVMRIITPPAKYYFARFKPNADAPGFGKKINFSWPLEESPLAKAGFKPKERYLAGIIDRRDNDIKIYDMSILVYQQLQTYKQDIEWGSPELYDVTVRKNSKGGPTGFYNVIPRSKSPLSKADIDLKEKLGDSLEKYLVMRTTPLSHPTVLKRMQEAGYGGGVVTAVGKPNGSNGALPETEDEDYSFNDPSQG